MISDALLVNTAVLKMNIGLALHFHPYETELPCSAEDSAAAIQAGLIPNIQTAQIYVTAPYSIAHAGQVYSAVKYTVVYATNPGIPLANYGPRLGFHIRDTEFIIILSRGTPLCPEWVFFSAHGKEEGTWQTWADCDVRGILPCDITRSHGVIWHDIALHTPDRQYLHIYIALGSHAMYPTPGNKARILCLANDQCASSGGMLWIVNEFAQATPELDALIPPGGTRITSQLIPMEVTWSSTQRIYMPIVDYIRKRIPMP